MTMHCDKARCHYFGISGHIKYHKGYVNTGVAKAWRWIFSVTRETGEAHLRCVCERRQRELTEVGRPPSTPRAPMASSYQLQVGTELKKEMLARQPGVWRHVLAREDTCEERSSIPCEERGELTPEGGSLNSICALWYTQTFMHTRVHAHMHTHIWTFTHVYMHPK